MVNYILVFLKNIRANIIFGRFAEPNFFEQQIFFRKNFDHGKLCTAHFSNSEFRKFSPRSLFLNLWSIYSSNGGSEQNKIT